MSARPGQINNPAFTVAAAILGSAAGRSMTLNNQSNAVITALMFTYVATATVGNRVPVVRILDSAGNILWQTTQGGNIAAGQTFRLAVGAGIQTVAETAPLMQFMPLPVEFTVPPAAQVVVFDNANIDVNDTISMVASLAQ